MKKNILVIISVVLASCSGSPSSEIRNVDSVLAAQAKSQEVDTNSFGVWSARIDSVGHDSLKLSVNGTVDLEKNNAKVELTKIAGKPAGNGELRLELSKRPQKAQDNHVAVKYQETLPRASLYKKISILHNDSLIKVIDKIDSASK